MSKLRDKHPHADATRCIHSGEDRHGQSAPLTTPIVQTSVFTLPNVEGLRRYAKGDSDLYLYSRYGNPTVTAVEEKMAALEGAEAALCHLQRHGGGDGCGAGGLPGGRRDCLHARRVRRDGEAVRASAAALWHQGTRFVPYHDIENADRYFSRKTRMLFLEIAHESDPALRRFGCAVRNWAGSAKLAWWWTTRLPLRCCRSRWQLGADIVLHSATKYLGGHSDLTAGVLAGSKKWMDAARAVMILTGGCLDPGCAYLLLRGLKTLDVRVERACRNAMRIAETLQQHPKVAACLLSRPAKTMRRTSWRGGR